MQTLEKHGHVLIERNPNGTYNLYVVTLAESGVSESACASIRKAIGGGAPMMPTPAPVAPSAPTAQETPSQQPLGDQILGILAALGGALGIRKTQEEVAPEGFEADAMKKRKGQKTAIKPRKGPLLWGGNLDIHATDPRIYLVLFPKRSKSAPMGFQRGQAKANMERIFKGSSSVTPNSGYAPTITRLLKNASDAEYWALRPKGRTKSKFASSNPDVGPDIGTDAWVIKVGNRGVQLVLANPSSSRAQKVLTPAQELIDTYLTKAEPDEAFVSRIDK